MTMRALVFKAPGVVVPMTVPVPELGPRDVMINVDACGVCGSDLASYAHGHYVATGQVMGHEIAGRIAALGREHAELPIGQRVAVRPMRTCGECSYCLAGNTHLCGETGGRSLGYGVSGGFAEQIVITDAVVGQDVFPVAQSLDPLDLLWVEPLAVAIHAVEQIGRPVSELLVIGGGAVGQTVVVAAIAAGMRVTVVEPLVARRAAAERSRARAFAPGALPGNARFDAVIDASGLPSAVRAALPYLAPGAPIVLVGLNNAPIPWPMYGHPLVGAFAYRHQDFVAAVGLVDSGRVRLGDLVSRRYSLEDAAQALRGPQPGDSAVKAAIIPQKEKS